MNQIVCLILLSLSLCACSQSNFDKEMKKDSSTWNALSAEERRVIEDKGTEYPFTGEFNEHFVQGTYSCKRCDAELFRSHDKFASSCGWPSFDDEIEGAIKRELDADGRRTEILCNNCDAHLGHVFIGEGLTDKNLRHCVNSISLNFTPDSSDSTKRAYFAGGCFWGVEYFFQNLDGVVETEVGYMGGHTKNPTYREVCTGQTGHLEVIEIAYDENKVTYEELVKLFFEIHDYAQVNGQGPDIGPQYRSAIFYSNDEERNVNAALIDYLNKHEKSVATELIKVDTFYPAEDYHQEYYTNTGKQPYCHTRREINWDK